MSKKALFLLPISLVVISTASCSWLFGGKNDLGYVTYSPDNVMNRRIKGDTHRITYKGFELSGDVAVDVIDRALETEYTYIKTVPEQSNNYFVLHVYLPSLMGYNRVNITFFENGYAKTDKYDTYYYEFDKNIAKSLCVYVDDAYEEEQGKIRREQEDMANTKRDYEKMIESMDIHTIINKIKEEGITDMEFTFTTDETPRRSYTFTFRDDGSIYDLLNAATYGVYDSSNYSTEGTVATLNIRVYTPHKWSIMVDKQAKYIDAYYSTLDKYNRSYAKHIRNSIDDDSLIAIMNRAYELSAPTNPFGNSSSNPSSSSEGQI